MEAKTSKKDIFKIVADKLAEQIDKGIIPWQRPWNAVGDSANSAVSYTSGKPYSFLNQMLLEFRVGEYLTFKQIKERGGKVKKGATASMIVFFQDGMYVKEEKDDDGNVIKEVKVSYPILKYYYVFHVDDTEGIEKHSAKVEEVETRQHTPIELCEQTKDAYLAREKTLKFNARQSGKAYYSPLLDEVVIPEINQYNVKEEYYSTMFHELAHSTGHAFRLNRVGITGDSFFGSKEYSKEELVAESASAMVLSYLGIDNKKAFNNSIAYLQGWSKAIRENNKLIWAFTQAERASKYILGINNTKEKEND